MPPSTPSLFDDPDEGQTSAAGLSLPSSLPPGARWDEVAAQAAGCQRCPLWRDATATVLG